MAAICGSTIRVTSSGSAATSSSSTERRRSSSSGSRQSFRRALGGAKPKKKRNMLARVSKPCTTSNVGDGSEAASPARMSTVLSATAPTASSRIRCRTTVG
jgi:hypothetical protein